MNFLDEILFNGECSEQLSDECANELLETLGINPIEKDELWVCTYIKLWRNERQIEIVIHAESLDYIDQDDNEIHGGYKITGSNVTRYDQDDGFDRYYPVF